MCVTIGQLRCKSALGAPWSWPASVDTLDLSISSEEGVLMGQPSKWSSESREQAVELVRATGKTVAEVARAGKSADAKRQEFARLRAAGLTRAEAAEQVGVDRRSAADWDKGIRVFYGGRVYPDGRIVHYRPEQRLAAVTSPRASYVQGEPVDLGRVERVIHSRYLSLLERERLYDLHRAGLSMRSIAVELGRAPSTISRELARNTTSTRGYLPHGAHRASVQRRRRPKQHKLLEGSTLRRYVEARLRKKWSPQQISHRLIKEFPRRPGDAGEHRDDLPGDLRPCPRRAQTRAGSPAATRARRAQTTPRSERSHT